MNSPRTDTRTISSEAVAPAAGTPERIHRLKPNAIGVLGVIFMSVATAAPITAMGGNVPISLGFGSGLYVPGSYVLACTILVIFSIGYMAMARNITAAGAFYGYVSHGLGQIIGMGTGLLATAAYIIFEVAIVGAFSYFGVSAFSLLFGVQIHWLVFALVMLALNAVMSFFDIKLASRVLGVFLIAEIFILALGAFATLFHGGGPFDSPTKSIPLAPLNPVGAISSAIGAGFGIFLAFWSWVGFESSAMYGEESRNPRRNIPRAIMVSVLGVGLFYVFVSWMAIAANGSGKATEVGQSASPLDVFFAPMEAYVGHWAVVLFNVLLMTGSYACGLAFHNCASRYLYALGREGLIPGLRSTLGRTHATRQSPHIAGFVQSIVATVLILAFFVTGKDPYIDIFALMGILGTLAILTCQCLCSFAVIGYFYGGKRPDRNWFTTLVAPLVSGLAFLGIIFLLFQNGATAAGTAAGSLLFKAIPYIVYGIFAVGLLGAVYLRATHRDRFQRIGRVVMEDSVERAPEQSVAP